jgi:hypothetical protein
MNPIICNNKNNWGYFIDIETQTILNENSILFLDAIDETQGKQLQKLQESENQQNNIISYIGITFIICIIINF